MVELIHNTLSKGSHLFLEASTGTGKTISSLAGLLPILEAEEGLRLLYLVRTNSQQQQVMTELATIKDQLGVALPAVALQGRSTLCPQADHDPELASSNADERSRLCGRLKTEAVCALSGDTRTGTALPGQTVAAVDDGKPEGGCGYFRRLYAGGPELVEKWSKDYLTAEALVARARAANICPYELNKLRLARARVIVAPYIFFFQPFIRRHLLEWLGSRVEDLIIVVDEAHNLPDYACQLASMRLGLPSILAAAREADSYGLALPEGKPVPPLLQALEAAMEALADRYVPPDEQEGLLPHQTLGWDSGLPTLETELMELAGATLRTLHKQAEGLVMLGAAVKEQKLSRGRRPRSYLGVVGGFLNHWLANAELHQVRLVANSPELALESACLDPSVVTSVLNRTAGALLMSGTLSPMGHYRDLLGLSPDSGLATYPSPFPSKNRAAHYLLDVTTRYAELNSDPKLWDLLQDRLITTLQAFKGNAAVFYPSYNLLERSLEGLRAAAPATAATASSSQGSQLAASAGSASIAAPATSASATTASTPAIAGAPTTAHAAIAPVTTGLSKPLYVERSGMEQEELMSTVETFKADTNSVLLGVMGGRLAEGIDYPDTTLELAILFGIPYSPPSARQRALVTYYDLKFVGRGWEYAVKAPATRKLLQAAGRLIRGPEDRGLCIILDKRAAGFKGYIEDLRAVADPVDAVREFFG